MKPKYILCLLGTHLLIGFFGFAFGIYLLPILIAPDALSTSDITQLIENKAVRYRAEFEPDRKGSDVLHWGEGRLSIGSDYIAFYGELSPGPDYKLYLTPHFVETEADFVAHKSESVYISDIDSFDNFLVTVPVDVDVGQYRAVVVWCETFGEFITSGAYR